VDVSAAQGYENTFDRESTADYDRGGNAGDLIVSAFQEAHDVECNRQPPVDGEPALALRSRRLRLAGRGQGRDCRRRRLASRVEPRPPHSPQGGKHGGAWTARVRPRSERRACVDAGAPLTN